MSQREVEAEAPSEQEITPVTAAKLLLFLVWWFSGIGVGTGFMSPSVIGAELDIELFIVIILSHFCSMLLILALLDGPDDSRPDA